MAGLELPSLAEKRLVLLSLGQIALKIGPLGESLVESLQMREVVQFVGMISQSQFQLFKENVIHEGDLN